MSSQFLHTIRDMFGGTRKNKKPDIRGTPSTITISSTSAPLSPSYAVLMPSSPKPQAFSLSPIAHTVPLIPVNQSTHQNIHQSTHQSTNHRHTKKNDSHRKRQNSLRRRAILQAYARKLNIDI